MLLGMFIGVFIGIILMCLLQINVISDAVTTVKQCESALEHERVIAIKEKRSIEYINGMSRIIKLFKNFYDEELEN